MVFNNISVISWRSVLLVEETGVPVEMVEETRKAGENHFRIYQFWITNLCGLYRSILFILYSDIKVYYNFEVNKSLTSAMQGRFWLENKITENQ